MRELFKYMFLASLGVAVVFFIVGWLSQHTRVTFHMKSGKKIVAWCESVSLSTSNGEVRSYSIETTRKLRYISIHEIEAIEFKQKRDRG